MPSMHISTPGAHVPKEEFDPGYASDILHEEAAVGLVEGLAPPGRAVKNVAREIRHIGSFDFSSVSASGSYHDDAWSLKPSSADSSL